MTDLIHASQAAIRLTPSLRDHFLPEMTVLWCLLPKVGVALLVGTLVGIEREYRGKLAGIKTNALICAASALFTSVGIFMSDYNFQDHYGPMNSDVCRISAQIVSGIGFLGAGAIFKFQNHIQGLTTAAVIWTVAALGIMIGFGIYIATVVISIIFVVFLSLTAYIERRYFRPISKPRRHCDDY